LVVSLKKEIVNWPKLIFALTHEAAAFQ
jgi:hypothetical protein